MQLTNTFYSTAVGLAALSVLSLAADVRSTSDGLNSLILQNGKKYFGTATDPRYFNDTQYVDILSNRLDWGQITPENSLKFESVQPRRGVYDFELSDQIMDWAAAQNYLVRCHALIWHMALPDWLTSATWDRDTLISVMEEHIRTVVTRYKGRCYAWDVVNEAVAEDGTLRSSLWSDTIGPDYINIAFALAAKYDPDAKLYYNDYGIEQINAKSNGSVSLVQRLVSEGVQIDGVGLQAHYPVVLAPSYDQQMESLARYASCGVEVAYTELDVFVDLPNDAGKTEHQAQIFTDTMRACLDTPKCVGVTLWNFYDPVSWVWQGVPGFGDPNLWWANYTEKPAYYALNDLLLNSSPHE